VIAFFIDVVHKEQAVVDSASVVNEDCAKD
jgi:hypothetical protein